MNGGLFKSASRFALVAAAGIVSGGIAAQAADLGGNCCADLEERVAELEATSARKGNRKVSLTVSGHVNEALIFWDDGKERNAYVVNNENSRTRFRFVGDAKISSDLSAGYLLEFGASTTASDGANQLNDDASAPGVTIRHSAWWLDSKTMGRVWVGQTSSASDGIASINLANTGNGSSASIFDMAGAGMILRRGSNVASLPTQAATWGSLTPTGGGDLGDGSRRNLVKYVTPTFAGFTASAAWGEDDFWDTALRYAGEFNGIRIAAGIAYQNITDTEFGCTGGLNASATNKTADCESIGGSGGIMHVPTGLFVHAAAGQFKDNLVKQNSNIGINAAARDSTSEYWYVQAGIEQNWFGVGKTTLYGEYYEGNFGTSVGVTDLARLATTANGFTAGSIASSEVTMWGLGFVQSIDAAAMDLYLGYKNFSSDLHTGAAGNVKQSPDDLKVFYAGGIIKF